MRRFIKLSHEVQNAAGWCARNGYRGVIGDPLPPLLSVRASEEIRQNPVTFKLAVHMASVTEAAERRSPRDELEDAVFKGF